MEEKAKAGRPPANRSTGTTDYRGAPTLASRLKRERSEIAVREGKLRDGPGRPKKGEGKPGNCQDLGDQGTTRAYTLARLRRDDPDMALRVEAGELSANAAATSISGRFVLARMGT